ncbi:MAG TPA: hypothetical protein IGP91_03420 [Thermosynechococcus sp. M46_R2017_013]|nr:hypothetical protein [Thermosynechococcus sp. M46_R2017_013]
MLYLAPRILPTFWFERVLIHRRHLHRSIADLYNPSGALESFAYKQILFLCWH